MKLQIGGTLEPCPPCKVILNGGFIAALAPFAAKHAPTLSIRGSAEKLGEAASIYIKMLSVLSVHVNVSGDWEGCDQAKLLISCIEGNNELDFDEVMNRWTADIWSAIADLAAGKLPTG